jgi:biofilm PGA synthesis N-glycosyltransferase PgaC
MHLSTAELARAVERDLANTRTELPRSTEPRAPRKLYISVAAKFAISAAVAAAWVTFAVWLSRPWLRDLSDVVGPVGAVLIVTLLAYVPGLIMSFMTMSLVLDRQPPMRVRNPTTGVAILIAARNEEAGIADTIRYAARSNYDGPVTIVLADNGSTDDTCAIAQQTADELGIDLVIAHEPTPGKSHALNRALEMVDAPVVVTVDADTLLHPEALRRLIGRLESAPTDTVAVAGAVMVRNSRANLLTKMQEWDYFLGISSVKRMQGLYQSTLVAQGAFSAYRTEDLRRIGGWPDKIGEDIVVTWRLMENGARIYTEPTAVAFTDAPMKLRHFARQRARWARGMLEGIASVPPWRQRRGLAKLVAGIDLLIPLLDVGYALIWLPGVALWLFGYPIIVSLWTLLVFPITVIAYGGLRRYQRHQVFDPLNLKVRRNRFGYIAYLLVYQSICSTASIVGYTQQLTRTTRRWK